MFHLVAWMVALKRKMWASRTENPWPKAALKPPPQDILQQETMYLLRSDLFLGTQRMHLVMTRLVWDRKGKARAEVVTQSTAPTERRCTFSSPREPGHTECPDNVYPTVTWFLCDGRIYNWLIMALFGNMWHVNIIWCCLLSYRVSE